MIFKFSQWCATCDLKNGKYNNIHDDLQFNAMYKQYKFLN